MRTLLTMTSATVLSLACASGGSEMRLADRQQIEQEVQRATDSLLAAAARTDTDGVFGMYLDAMHADQGALHTLGEMRDAYGDIYAAVDTIAFTLSVSNTHVLGPDAALWIGEGTARAMAADTVYLERNATWTIVWERQDGDWKVRHLHQSNVTPEPAG